MTIARYLTTLTIEMKIKYLLKSLPVLPIIIVGIIALSAAPAYYFFATYMKSQTLLSGNDTAKQEVQLLAAKVGKHIALPSEEPTVATVSDKAKLKDQPFFQKAENGDKVLIYTKTRKAILYRPSTDIIIDVSSVNVGMNADTAVASAQASNPLKLAIYNGTTKAGLASSAEKQIKSAIADIEIADKRNAKKSDYKKTLVIDLKGTQSAAAVQIAQLLKGEVAPLPTGETKPEGVDLVVILGSE